MPSARTLSATADHQSMEISKSAHIFRFTINELVAVWTEITTPYVRRAMSTDGGVTWTRMDPTSISFNGATQAQVDLSRSLNRPLLYMCSDGNNVIYGFNLHATSPQMFKFAWNGTYWTDTILGYTYTTSISTMIFLTAHASGEARFDGVKSAIHVAFHAEQASGGGTTSNIVLLSFSLSLVKIVEVNFVSTTTQPGHVALKVSADATPNVFLARRDSSDNGSIILRRYTFNGAAYTLVDADETAVALGVSAQIGGIALSIDAVTGGLCDVIWTEAPTGTLTGALKTRKRTAVNTYSAITTLVAAGLPGNQIPGAYLGFQHELAIYELGTGTPQDIWVFYKYTANYLNGELYQIRRTAGTWRTAILITGGSTAGRNLVTPLQQVTGSGADGYLHFLYAIGDLTASPWSVVYDRLALGLPGTPTTVTPADNAQTSATPTITATYVQNKIGDNLGKYRVEVQRVSDSASFWDTSLTTYSGATVAPGGTFSIVYAGTALVKGTPYKVRVTLTDADESYNSSPSSFSTFSWNDPAVATAVSPTVDSPNAKTKLVAFMAAAVAGTSLAAASVIFRRRLSAVGSTVAGAWTALSGVVTVTAATITGFSAYRQIPGLTPIRNLMVNGATVSAYGWNLHATVSAVVDSTSVTGWAFRQLATATAQNSTIDLRIEPSKVYSWAARVRSGDSSPNTDVIAQWFDGAGTFPGNLISTEATIGTTSAAWTEVSLLNRTAPDTARVLRIVFRASNSGTAMWTAFRVMQQATVPTWVAAHQQFLSQGIEVYESATNLLINGDAEQAFSGVVNALDDPFADLNAWTTISGSPSVASNLVTLNGALIKGGHPELWDWATPQSQVRFSWLTSGTASLYLRYVDSNNWVRLRVDGTNLHLDKKILGTVTSDVTAAVAASLTNGNFYWFVPTISGTSFTGVLKNDNAGASSGSTVATIGPTTISDTQVTTGALALEGSGAAIQFGGNFSIVCVVAIAAPPSWSAIKTTGVVSFCVSKVNKYSGLYSLSIYSNDAAGGRGRWRQTTTVPNTGATISCRGKVANLVVIAGPGAGILIGGLGSVGVINTTWTTSTRSGTPTANQPFECFLDGASGIAYFDNMWLATQNWDTGNADFSGQAYVPNGARTASSLSIAIPSTLSFLDWAACGVVRMDHADTVNKNSDFLKISANGSNYYQVIRSGGGGLGMWIIRVRSGTLVSTPLQNVAMAAGDTLAWAIKQDSTGLYFLYSLNGAAVVTSSLTTPEAQIVPFTVTPPAVAYIGMNETSGNCMDGTYGIFRWLKGGLTTAQIAAILLNPYQDPTDNDLAVWNMEGGVQQLPVYDDRIIALGTSYDYRADATATAATPTVTVGQAATALTPWTQATNWWLKSETDSTLDTQITVVDRSVFRQPRATQVFEPIAATRKQVIRAAFPYGDEGKLKIFFTSLSDQTTKLAALRALLATNGNVWLQDPYGILRRIAITEGIDYDPHETMLEVTLTYIEV